MNYILAIENTSWKISIEYLTNLIIKNFQKIYAERIEGEDRPYCLFWRCESLSIEGFLHKSGDSLHCSGNHEGIINLVLKILPDIPNEATIHLFDNTYDYHMIVNQSTTKQEIDSIFMGLLGPSQES